VSDAQHIPNIDYLGRCYDVVDTDPLNLGSSAKYENAIDISVEEGRTTQTPDGSYRIPAGVHHKAIFSMSWESQSSVISSSYDFQEEFKVAVNAEAGVQGGFEFSGSASQKDIVRRTESRKQSFVFSRAYQENHGLQLDLSNEDAPLGVTHEFAAAVRRLPLDEFMKVVPSYDEFLGRFGTHVTTEIILGGLAFQRTSGSSSKYLKSRESEDEFKAKAAVQLDALKAEAGAEQARRTAQTVDSEYGLERTSLEFRGGDGSPSGIDASWIASLHQRPTIVKAQMERLSVLLAPRFFPDDPDIWDRANLVDLAISDWIVRKGRPSCDSAPLRYGEALALMVPWTGGKVIQPGILGNWLSKDALTIGFPLGPDRMPRLDAGDVAAVRLESLDGRRAGAAVLAGDAVRMKLLGGDSYLAPDLKVVRNVGSAGAFTVMLAGDDPAAPSRLGEFLLEPDRVVLMKGRPGAPEAFVRIDEGGRYLNLTRSLPYSTGFTLKRCDDSAA
jgi:hypothetical protein